MSPSQVFTRIYFSPLSSASQISSTIVPLSQTYQQLVENGRFTIWFWQCLPQWATPAQLTCWSGDIKGALSTYFLIANHPKVPPKHFVTIYNHRLGGLSRVVVNDRLKRTVVQLRWGRTSGVYIKVRSPLTREYVCTRYKGCGEPLG